MLTLENEVRLEGSSVSEGLALGKLYLQGPFQCDIPCFAIGAKEIESEIERFKKALSLASKDIKKILTRLKREKAEEGIEILNTHLALLRDPGLLEEMEKGIRKRKENAESIFQITIDKLHAKFLNLDDPYLRERSGDIVDIGRRVMGHLMQQNRVDLSHLPVGSIVFVPELTPSMVAEASPRRVNAFITTSGSSTSHAAIVARAKGIGFVSSISFDSIKPYIGELVAVDAGKGEVILAPSKEIVTHYKREIRRLKQKQNVSNDLAGLAAETQDGVRVKLSANIDFDSEMDLLHQYGGEGIGLYRSEFAFLQSREIPDEEEQYLAYRKIIEKLKGLPIVIRTFDIGGDKAIASPHLVKEGHPFLGLRAIRFFLKEKDLFRTQLRAILRAAKGAQVSILFPMISALTELREALSLVEECKAELKHKKIPYEENVRIGCMIEVPSAALIADLLAAESQFLSIGTNDLVQYSLAVDRSDHTLSGYYTPSHPAVLRLIRMTVEAADREGIPVSVCGEAAADREFVPLLLGLGVRELSVAARYLRVIKEEIRSIKMSDARQLAKKALSSSTAMEIDYLLETWKAR